MYRYVSIVRFLFLIMVCCEAKAQTTLQGRVYEYGTHIHLQSIRVTNLNTKQFTITDTAGLFYINAKAGDLLAFKGYAYQADTLVIINKNRLEIYMTPEGKTLKQVNVTAPDIKTGSLKDANLKGNTVTYQRDANGAYKGGIAIRFGYGKDKKALRSKQLSDEEIADQEIEDAFSEKNVAKTIPLRGQELKDFIAMYRPDIKTFKAPTFNLTIYLNDCYKKYQALPPEKRKPATLNP
ncbi:hypothetical protein [Mucilaginibacter paludis]|uniref:TonB-dependent receptor plug n=1 Tax=Mucilaginibacter paludis DSM 18603 TaxID=714943 RepID=H1YCN8_9SPHI|nr:hypothetical protein [Mucilaginibacter paludis]EHQ24225.1 hypothetical protein Mucpa_0021 [Mucilaginibacter paludis DSM 18603]